MEKLIIKEESILLFFEGITQEQYEMKSSNRLNLYYYFKDNIICEKTKIKFNNVKNIEFTISDFSNGSNAKLVNTYLYEVKEYDSISYELVLVDFKVNLVNNK